MYKTKGKSCTSILEIEDFIRTKYAKPGKKILFVPVAAFGIAYNAYLVDENDTQMTFKMDHKVCTIKY